MIAYAAKAEKPNLYECRDEIFPTQEDIACELQLAALGDWVPLDFKIDYGLWKKNEKTIQHLYKPFQPTKGVMNDRESILIYGMEGDTATTPTGLDQYKAKLGYRPSEELFTYPTEAHSQLTCMNEIFEYFDDWTRSFIVKLNHGGHYPYHRDHCRINRETIRLIVFFGDSNGGLDWEVDGKNMSWYPNRMYYVNTMKRHRLSAWQKDCAMGVFTVRKNWNNVTRIMSRYL